MAASVLAEAPTPVSTSAQKPARALMMSEPFSTLLDLFRGLAATAVFVEHLRTPLFPGLGNLDQAQQTPAVKLWYFVTGFGFESVMVFFVLSGFLIGGFGLARARAGRFEARRYAVDRFSRLYVVLIPALILTVALDRLGASYTDAGFWTNASPILREKYDVAFVTRDTWRTVLCNAAMLQSFYCPVAGSNIPLWSLSYEFWFYVAFGVAMVSLRSGLRRMIGALVIAAVVVFLGYKFVLLSLVWGMGIGVYLYRGRALKRPLLSTCSFLGAATLSRVLGAGEPDGSAQDLVLLLVGACFAWMMISYRDLSLAWLLKLQRPIRNYAGFSYTLYLVHFPMMLIVIALLYSLGLRAEAINSPSSLAGVTVYVAVLAIVLVLAWLLSTQTEKRTGLVRKWLEKQWTPRVPDAHPGSSPG